MMSTTGLIHVYFGEGKGKTTTGMGLCLRAAGYGYQVAIYQFMKDNATSERKILEQIPNITLFDGLSVEKFSFQMSPQERLERMEFYKSQFESITAMCRQKHFQVLFLDEILYTIRAGLFPEEVLLDFLMHKPSDLEVILTGQEPSDTLLELADYASRIQKVKHPFDSGIPARAGIER